MGFSKIKGQERAIQIIKNSLRNQAFSHAYLLVGPDGVGKKATALALAQAINCEHYPENDGISCQKCLSCLKMASSNQPDVEIIKADGLSIKIDQIRAIKNKVFYKCYESNYKVIIFDDAHFFTIEAANSLLKVLEEPPEKTVFILVTSEAQKLPDTIISRCQQIQFQPLSSVVIKEIISEQYPDKIQQVALIATLARGSLAKAQELLEEGAFLEKRVETFDLLKNINSKTLAEIVFWCEKWDKDSFGIKIILEMIEFWFRDVLIWHTTQKGDLIINQDYLLEIRNEYYSLPSINRVLKAVHKNLKSLENNVNPRLVLEVFLLKLKLNLI